MTNTIEAINRVLANWECGKAVHGELLVKTLPADDTQAVWELVGRFPFDQGWLCLTDRVVPLNSVADLTEELRKGTILSAELAKGNESLHIRQCGAAWIATRYTAGEGTGCLKLEQEYVSTESRQRERLEYDVYWRIEEGSYRPWAARFTGFADGGKRQ